MKKSLTIAAVACFTLSLCQVGINTDTPSATLDIVGSPSDISKLDGVIAPRLTGNELAAKTYTAAQTGAIIYATAPASTLTGQVINVSATGYYYFDGSVWNNMASGAPLGDLRIVGSNNHITQDAGQNSTGTTTGSGWSNIFIGQATGDSALISAHQNIFIGDYAGAYSKTHSAVVIGYAAGQSLGSAASAPDEAAVIIGKAAGLNLDSVDTDGASHTVMIGDNAGSRAGSFLNGVILGSEAGFNSDSNNGNVYIGKQAGYQDTNSSDNVLIGNKAGYDNIGSSNISIGASAGYSSHGNDNILIGKSAGSTLNANNNIIIGNNVSAANNTGNQLNIGNWIYGDNGSIGIGTTTPKSTLQVNGSVAANFRTLASGTVANNDYTVMVTGNISLPNADNTNVGRIYYLINGNTNNNTISGTFMINGSSFTNYTLNNSDLGRGVLVQSTGSIGAWLILNRY
ncbi:hypothetical protein [Epilithonimonas sp.]|uniref:hypothetical protein n=1 Tax=Epilithonimonas sp. TaxID=2894511 RepID=UPI0035B44D34